MANVTITVYPPEQQGTGAFDGGRITEIKPIGFPGEGSAVRRIGPLFYWAWATGHGYGKIGLHPHQGFEIMSYVIAGEIGHRDTLGKASQVKAGGAQVMQTGSGVSHEEEFLGERTEMFQIWFEPELRAAVTRSPTYAEVHSEQFPVSGEASGVSVKHLLGKDAPISLVAEVTMQDVSIGAGKAHQYALPAGRSLAVVAVKGTGEWKLDEQGEGVAFGTRDFSVLHAREDAAVSVTAGGGDGLRLAMIEVPTRVDYPLYSR